MNIRGISREVAKQRVLGMVPVLRWLPSYDKSWLKFDLIAGLTLAAFAIPDNMAYATLAGLPPEYGLYAGIMAPLAYFVFATSRHASVGPSSSEAIMVATFLAAILITSYSKSSYLHLPQSLLECSGSVPDPKFIGRHYEFPGDIAGSG